MATKFGLAGGIPERRVRPIWDAVDSRQFKAALKLCTGLLSKYPNSPYALALKALILERMGKPDEALSICLSAREQLFSNDMVHIDDLTLSTLQMVLQRLNRLDLATSCYEHACGKYLNNLELMMGLFNCYVREYAYVKQQQTAIKMYKIVGEERFLLWAVCSIQLQVFCTGAGDKLLPLAEALLRKHISAHSLHEPEALFVYIAVLEQQAKYAAALEVLSGSLGSLLSVEADKLRMQGRLLARAGDYNAAIDVFQKILELCPDDWESFLHYLGCLLEEDMCWSKEFFSGQLCFRGSNSCKPCHLDENLFEERISSALSFIEKLQLKVNGDPVRCPYLAKIEIEKCLRLHGKSAKEKLQEALLEYFTRFSHLACFASDIEVFLDILTHEEKAELLDKFMEVNKSLSSTPLQTLGRAVTIFRIKELFVTKFGLFVSGLRDTSLKMVDMYCKNLFFSKDLDPQENMHGEELLSMACSVLVQLFWRTSHLGYLLEAILILEFGLAIRRHVWQYKILLLHLYSYLGALPLAYEWYGTLEIKNILLETVSHHILPQMLKSPLWSDLADLMREYLKFMDDYMREAADLTFVAYRHRNYSKAIEFVLFKERLQNSCQYLMANVETSILQLKQADNLEEVERTLENLNFGIEFVQLSNEEGYKSLTFNEDLHSRPWWSPTPDINYLFEPFGRMDGSNEKLCKRQAGGKQAIVSRVIKRSFLPRMVYLSTQVAPSSFKETIEANGSLHDKKSFLELKSLLEQYSADLGYPFEEAIKVITGISEDQKSFKDFGSDVLCWMNFAIFFNAWNLRSHHSGELAGERFSHSTWNLVDRLIQKCIKEQLASSQPPLTCPGSNLPVLVLLVTESCSWHILIIQSYLRSMLPSGKKKKKSGPADQLSAPLSHVIRRSIESLSSAVEEVKKWLDHQLTKSPDESVDVLLSLLQKAEGGEGPGHVFQMVEGFASVGNPELGERISLSLQSWSSSDVLRKFVKAQHTMLLKFHQMCESKLTLLESLKASVQHV